MDTKLYHAYEKLLEESRMTMQIENKKWPSYIRSQFAELRSAIKEVEKRKKELPDTGFVIEG